VLEIANITSVGRALLIGQATPFCGAETFDIVSSSINCQVAMLNESSESPDDIGSGIISDFNSYLTIR